MCVLGTPPGGVDHLPKFKGATDGVRKLIRRLEMKIMEKDYRVCAQCVMDTTLPDIEFDEGGVCNYCKRYEDRVRTELDYTAAGQSRLQTLIERIKREGARQDYDCIIGVSGGADSTYVAHLVKNKFGLRPLAVHLDNGWDAELAVANVEKVLKRLGIDLHTNVLNWKEFRDLQVSFLKSSIAHVEIPTDHAIWATLIRSATAYKIRYIISGINIVTEGVAAHAWLYDSKDARLIKGIHAKFGTVPLKTFPMLDISDFAYSFFVRGIRWIPMLNYVPYNKSEAKQIIIDDLGWRDYGGKHYESVFTRFQHAFWLPHKFNIDMRRPYLSALVLSRQMSREQALLEVMSPPSPKDQLNEDVEYVIKKLNLTQAEFDRIVAAPRKSHNDYPNNAFLWRGLPFAVNLAHRLAVRV
jgi:N-acetyl sugar amidotransferase